MTVKIEGLEAVVKKIDSLGKPGAFRRPMTQAVAHLQDKIAKTPTGNQHRPQPFKTDKQRRFFFWALREGVIKVPYKRGSSPGSEKLGSSWTTTVSANGRKGTVGNDTTYGQLVQGQTRQTGYHAATGWNTVQSVVKKEQGKVLKFFQREYEVLLNK